MKKTRTFIAVLTIAVSGTALAQAGSTVGDLPGGNGPGTGASDQTRAASGTQAASRSSRKAWKWHKEKKSMKDMSNTPGSGAHSDTMGH